MLVKLVTLTIIQRIIQVNLIKEYIASVTIIHCILYTGTFVSNWQRRVNYHRSKFRPSRLIPRPPRKEKGN
jgi:hypothetical protein